MSVQCETAAKKSAGATLATVVGVLIEVAVMLLAVRAVNSTVDWYEQGEGIPGYDECCPGIQAAGRS